MKRILRSLAHVSLLAFVAQTAAAPRLQCERLLVASDGEELSPRTRMHYEASWILTALDADRGPEKIATRALGARPEAILEFLKDLDIENLRLKTHFGENPDKGPEIEIYRSVPGKEDEILGLIVGRTDRLYFWKEIDQSVVERFGMGSAFMGGGVWKSLPRAAEVGFVSVARTRGVGRRYVSVKFPEGLSFVELTIGIDVSCEVAPKFTTRKSIQKIVTDRGVRCRIPVLRSKFKPEFRHRSF
jgi:hypothetical protein